MVQITRGSDVTLKSIKLENRIFEGFYWLKNSAVATNDFDVVFNLSLDNKTLSIDYTLPARHVINENGETVLSGVAIPLSIEFKKGTGGQFVSDSLSEQLVEMIMFGQNLELIQISGTDEEERITSRYDSDLQTLSGTITLDIDVTASGTNGLFTMIASEFLN